MQRIFKAISERPTNPAFDSILTEQRQRPYVRRYDSDDAEEQDAVVGSIKGQVSETPGMSTSMNFEKNGMNKNTKGRLRGRIVQKDRQSDRDASVTGEKSEEDDRDLDLTLQQGIVSAAKGPFEDSDADRGDGSRRPAEQLNALSGPVHEKLHVMEPKVVGTTMRIEVNNVVSSMIAAVEKKPHFSNQAKRAILENSGESGYLESKKRLRLDDATHL